MMSGLSRLLPVHHIRVMPILCIILLGSCMIPSFVSAADEDGYSGGWMKAPTWLLDRIDTKDMPDLFIPKNVTGKTEEKATVSSYVQNGNDLLAGGSYEDAKKNFEGAIGLSTLSFEAWLGRGQALEGLNRSQSSLESYEKAIGLSKKKDSAWAAYAGKGRISLDIGQYQVAADAFQKAIDIFNGAGSDAEEQLMNLYLGLGKAKQNLGEDAAASIALQKAKEMGAEV